MMFVAGQQIHVPAKTFPKPFTLLRRIGPVGKKHLQFHFLGQPAKPRSLVLNRMTGENAKTHRYSGPLKSGLQGSRIGKAVPNHRSLIRQSPRCLSGDAVLGHFSSIRSSGVGSENGGSWRFNRRHSPVTMFLFWFRRVLVVVRRKRDPLRLMLDRA